jgi:trimeric autotransporter adhesin
MSEVLSQDTVSSPVEMDKYSPTIAKTVLVPSIDSQPNSSSRPNDERTLPKVLSFRTDSTGSMGSIVSSLELNAASTDDHDDELSGIKARVPWPGLNDEHLIAESDSTSNSSSNSASPSITNMSSRSGGGSNGSSLLVSALKNSHNKVRKKSVSFSAPSEDDIERRTRNAKTILAALDADEMDDAMADYQINSPKHSSNRTALGGGGAVGVRSMSYSSSGTTTSSSSSSSRGGRRGNDFASSSSSGTATATYTLGSPPPPAARASSVDSPDRSSPLSPPFSSSSSLSSCTSPNRMMLPPRPPHAHRDSSNGSGTGSGSTSRRGSNESSGERHSLEGLEAGGVVGIGLVSTLSDLSVSAGAEGASNKALAPALSPLRKQIRYVGNNEKALCEVFGISTPSVFVGGK